ncbi:MAG TPA: PfkB family carbohydrate kinase [Anaerolineaceae bacterium]
MGTSAAASLSPTVVCMGEILIDFFPAELGRKIGDVTAFRPKPGGGPANVSVAIRKLGVSSALISKVGDDAFGAHLIEAMGAEGVETRGMRVDARARTTLAFIAQPDPNHPEFVFYRNPGADLLITPEELDRELIAGARAFQFGSLSLVDEPARSATREGVRLAHEAGALVAFDVNYRPSLWARPEDAVAQARVMIPGADVLKVNEVEIQLLAGGEGDLLAASRKLLALGPRLIAVTLGPNGSFFCAEGASGRVDPFVVETVDAVGCGDAFLGALLTRLTSSPDWHSRLTSETLAADFRFANAAGALTATRQGVIPALPTAEEVEGFLAVQESDS